jgi:glycosyltransferase involved in cell wall biosynthesis
VIEAVLRRLAQGRVRTGGLERSAPAVRRAWHQRLQLLAETLGPAGGTAETALTAALDGGTWSPDSVVWLALSVLRGELPTDEDVVQARRRVELEGAGMLLNRESQRLAVSSVVGGGLLGVRVVAGATVADVHDTASHATATGIQRVARQTVRRWAGSHDVLLVRWSDDFRRLLPLDEVERARAQGLAHVEDGAPRPPVVLVPWRCTYLVPELAAEPPRAARLRAVARFAHARTGVIGFDCVPLTAAETVGAGMGGWFASSLSFVKHTDAVAGISDAAASEYAGLRTAVAAQGLSGPRVTAVALPAEAGSSTPAELEAAALAVGAGVDPLVLCVGSHEPRKNHLALLHAAELLWRRGTRFQLTFLGAAGWRNEEFFAQVRVLQDAGRAVHVLERATDAVLWAAYRLARVVVFPSVHEGFGLPVAEALACGTPVVTSGFGSMAELAKDGGAVTVDPYDDHSIAAALGDVLTDDRLHARLVAQARDRPRRTWDEYAAETWAFLTAGSGAT